MSKEDGSNEVVFFWPATGERKAKLEAENESLLQVDLKSGINSIQFKTFVRNMIVLLGGNERQHWQCSKIIAYPQGRVSFELSYDPHNDSPSIVISPEWQSLPEDERLKILNDLSEPYFKEYLAFENKPNNGEFIGDERAMVHRSQYHPPNYRPKTFTSLVLGREIPIELNLKEREEDGVAGSQNTLGVCKKVYEAYKLTANTP